MQADAEEEKKRDSSENGDEEDKKEDIDLTVAQLRKLGFDDSSSDEDEATKFRKKGWRRLYKVTSETKRRVGSELTTKFTLIVETDVVCLEVSYFIMGRRLAV